MYEHMRNSFLAALMSNFDSSDVDKIGSILDNAAKDFDISEKSTALMIVDDEEIFKIPKLYLASKRLEGLSDLSLRFYANRLKIFFETVRRMPQDITKCRRKAPCFSNGDIRRLLFS